MIHTWRSWYIFLLNQTKLKKKQGIDKFTTCGPYDIMRKEKFHEVFVVFIETSDSLWIVFEQYSHALQTITPICHIQDRDNKVWLEHENITR